MTVTKEMGMEGMDADCYVLEYAIRDRLAVARARARTAALLLEATDPPRSPGVETRLVHLGTALASWARRLGAEISEALSTRRRTSKPSPTPLPARRGS
jgi:hypothetical protein